MLRRRSTFGHRDGLGHTASMAQFELGDASDLKQKWKNIIPADSTTKAAENPDGCFDCNICLDSAQDPVVTLCGHLFCWPCIYQLLHVQPSSALSADHRQNCPVCKAHVSPASLVPLYGSGSKSKRPTLQGVGVPRRPAACGLDTLINTTTADAAAVAAAASPPNPRRSQRILHDPHPYYGGYSAASAGLGDVRLPSGFSPMVGMLGKMVYSSIYGRSDTISLFSYPYQNSYGDVVGGRSGRSMRRLEMQAYQSLDRVSFFLFCFFVFCFLLF
ncbi:E3 ubiquitin-protein ligase RMA3-like [Malania oleifera]|uniref:E3 ubiquitin-protein ligase RMA3-like n=1 Tax=Malania oleifera TaxID=397392 RepID=UPI0025AE8653|nr:E3 ubiquitin-protein ligase RMA3-like [Malania oleifera]